VEAHGPVPAHNFQTNQDHAELTDHETARAVKPDENKVTSISQRKREANRQNALRSTGPRTETGKSHSRWNALKHGLFAKHVPLEHWAIDDDDRKTFRMLLKELIAHFEPVGPIEGILVERVAQSYWKLGRIQRAANALIWVGLSREEKSESEGLREYGSLEEDSAQTNDAFKKSRKSLNQRGSVLSERKFGYKRLASKRRVQGSLNDTCRNYKVHFL
jgi:hypothetical protein